MCRVGRSGVLFESSFSQNGSMCESISIYAAIGLYRCMCVGVGVPGAVGVRVAARPGPGCLPAATVGAVWPGPCQQCVQNHCQLGSVPACQRARQPTSSLLVQSSEQSAHPPSSLEPTRRRRVGSPRSHRRRVAVASPRPSSPTQCTRGTACLRQRRVLQPQPCRRPAPCGTSAPRSRG